MKSSQSRTKLLSREPTPEMVEANEGHGVALYQSYWDAAPALPEPGEVEAACRLAEHDERLATGRLYGDAADLIAAQKAEVARLQQAIGLMTTAVPSMEVDVNDPVGMAQRVVAENEQLRQDAERYRWLRQNMTYYNTSDSDGPVLSKVSKLIWYHATDQIDDTLDAAIDAAKGKP